MPLRTSRQLHRSGKLRQPLRERLLIAIFWTLALGLLFPVALNFPCLLCLLSKSSFFFTLYESCYRKVFLKQLNIQCWLAFCTHINDVCSWISSKQCTSQPWVPMKLTLNSQVESQSWASTKILTGNHSENWFDYSLYYWLHSMNPKDKGLLFRFCLWIFLLGFCLSDQHN